VGSLYSVSGVLKMEGAIDATTNELMNQIAFFSSTRTPFDLSEWMQRYVESYYTPKSLTK
jgi:hypothetical protein